MAMNTDTSVSVGDLQDALRLLYVERALAELQGFASDPSYMADLLDEIRHHKSALTGLVVTEIAALRADLGAPLRG
jgi:hypothetical protein